MATLTAVIATTWQALPAVIATWQALPAVIAPWQTLPAATATCLSSTASGHDDMTSTAMPIMVTWLSLPDGSLVITARWQLGYHCQSRGQ